MSKSNFSDELKRDATPYREAEWRVHGPTIRLFIWGGMRFTKRGMEEPLETIERTN